MSRILALTIATLLLSSAWASAQSNDPQPAVVKMVDLERNIMVVAVPSEGGIKIMEITIPPKTKFVDSKKKKIKNGLKDGVFKAENGRPDVAIGISYATVNGKQVIKQIQVK